MRIPHPTRQQKSCFMLWCNTCLLLLLTLSNCYILLTHATLFPYHTPYRPGFIMGDYFHLVSVPQTSGYWYVNQDFFQYYVFFVIFFFAYAYWYHELNDDDELTIPLDQRLPTILFDKSLTRLAKLNLIVPFITAVITGNLWPDGILALEKGILITATIQIICFMLYLVRFCRVWQQYCHIKTSHFSKAA